MENYLYVPVLKTKQNEFLALNELSDPIKNRIKPLFVLTQEKYQDRANSLSKNLSQKWNNRDLFLDISQVNDFIIAGLSHVNFIFNDLVKNKVNFTPVIHLYNQNTDIMNFVISTGVSSAILVKIKDFKHSTPNELQQLISLLPNVTDIILDFESDIAQSRQNHSFAISNHVNHISTHIPSNINIVILGSSIPSELPRDNYIPFGFESRVEWLGFYDYYHSSQKNNNNMIFGDYSISHPEEFEPTGYVNPNAKIRYTISDNYLFAVGYQVYTHSDGFAQYHAMAGYIVSSPFFMGQNYSWGDNYLYNCSIETGGPGNMGIWVKVGHNHHITFVTHQVAANLYGILI
ncbi:TPA: beta family protein [Pasteurella multocida]|nr:beta family protein [Pasteurella multocida]